MSKLSIQIIETKTNTVVETIPLKNPSMRLAEKVEDGVNINLDHENYHTTIKTEME